MTERIGRTIKQRIEGRPLALRDGGDGTFPKPGELIDVVELTPLTYADRLTWDLLMVGAWPNIDKPNFIHRISKAVLRGSHESNDALMQSIERLMGAIVRINSEIDGEPATLRVQLLGPSVEQRRQDGLFLYKLHPDLVDVVKRSDSWGRLRARVLLALSSKYGLALYEMVAKRANLHQTYEDFSLERIRALLGVPDGKLTRFPDLRRYCLEPAVQEVDALSQCNVAMSVLKIGRLTTGIRLHWARKDEEGLRLAEQELARHSTGRKARIAGKIEPVVKDPTFLS